MGIQLSKRFFPHSELHLVLQYFIYQLYDIFELKFLPFREKSSERLVVVLVNHSRFQRGEANSKDLFSASLNSFQ